MAIGYMLTLKRLQRKIDRVKDAGCHLQQKAMTPVLAQFKVPFGHVVAMALKEALF